MTTVSKIRIVLLIALIADAAILYSPKLTRQYASAQITTTWQSPTRFWGLDDNDLREIGRDHPRDYQAQFASTLVGSSQERVAAQQALLNNHPNDVQLLAALLRSETKAWIDMDSLNWRSRIPANVAHLQRFDADAALCERLDPDNAYFPTMRAVGRFAAGDNAGGEAEFHRAAECHEFNEYVAEEARALWHDSDLANGWTSGFTMMNAFGAVLFPHLAQIRAAVRLAIADARADEAANKPAVGMAIRLDCLRIGGLMRAHSTSSIGALVGVALTRIAIGHPGGQDAPGASALKGKFKELDIARSTFFLDYLSRTGHPELVDTISKELDSGRKVKEIVDDITKRDIEVPDDEKAEVAWFAGYLGLANVTIILSVWLLAELWIVVTSRRRLIWVPSMWFPTASALALVASGILGLVGSREWSPLVTTLINSCAAICFVGWASLTCATTVSVRRKKLSLRKAVLASVLAFAVPSAISLLGLFQIRGMNSLMSSVDPDTAKQILSGASGLDQIAERFAGLGIVLFVGLMCVAIRNRFGWRVRVAEIFSIVACAALIFGLRSYESILRSTDKPEAELVMSMNRLVDNDGAYKASLVGQEWPGEVVWPLRP